MKVKIYKIRLSEDYIFADQKMLDHFLEQNTILKFETAFVKDEECYWSVILYYESCVAQLNEDKSPKYCAAEDEVLSENEVKILESLKIWRSLKAKDQKLPVYFIATNKELFSIAKFKPAKKEELCDIKGFGKHKIENYGEEIIEILETV